MELDGRTPTQIRREFAGLLDAALGRGVGTGESSLRTWSGPEGSIWHGENVDCLFIVNIIGEIVGLDCEGTTCSPQAMLREVDSEEPFADIFFACENGCDVDFAALTYDCGGGGVDEGSGNGTGGEEGTPGAGAPWSYSHVLENGNPDACKLREPGCVLEEIPDSLMARLRTVLGTLPGWLQAPILDILNDSIVTRVHLWRDSLFDQGHFVESDTHGALEAVSPMLGYYNPNAWLHFHLSSWETDADLKRLLCHEAIHLYWQLTEDDEDSTAWSDKATACVANPAQ